jgi:CspA family cold shock protein
VRHSHVDRRSTRYAARQFVSDIETEGVAVMTNEGNGTIERTRGIVKFYNSEKGFGFARRENGASDVFIHANALKRSGIEGPVKTGDKLEFDVLPVDGKGPKANNIRLLPK